MLAVVSTKIVFKATRRNMETKKSAQVDEQKHPRCESCNPPQQALGQKPPFAVSPSAKSFPSQDSTIRFIFPLI